jgi:type I restriction enzyme S subunit
LLTRRLDPDYYAPQHLRDEEALLAIGAIELGSTGRLFAGPFGSKLPTSVFVDDGVPLFRVGNVGAMEVDSNDLARITPDLHQELSASEVVPGDVLIVKASVGEKVCVLPKSIERANVTQHIIGLHPNGAVDEYYVASAIYSSYGRRQVQRRALGAIIQYLGVVEARTVLLPDLSPHAQSYIGNKVRQAEALKRLGSAMREAVQTEVDSLVGLTAPEATWRTTPGLLDAYRLNATHYDPVVLAALEHVRATKGTKPISAIVGTRKLAGGATPRGATYESTGVRFLRVQNVRPWGLDHSDSVFIDDHTDNAIGRSKLAEDDIVLTITGYPGTASLVTDADLPANINQHSVRFNVGNGWPPGYVAAVINSRFVKLQVERLAIGGTRDALDYPSVRALELPVLPDSAMQSIDGRVRRTLEFERAARALVQAAPLLVEALVEGAITDSELAAAARSAEQDCEVLGRLTKDGLDAPGSRPLFPDLDRLAELVAEAGAEEDAE